MSRTMVLVGETNPQSRTPQRVQALGEMGWKVRVVSSTGDGFSYDQRPSLMRRLRYRLRLPADPAGANAGLLAAAPGAELLWIDNAAMLHPKTLVRAKALAGGAPLVWYCEDDMMNPRLGSRYLDRALGLFDLWVTTKSFNCRAEELPARGVRRTLFVNNSFDPALHRPVAVSDEDRLRLGADISFAGTYEVPRAASMLRLAQSGLTVRVWGNGWGRMAGLHPNLRIEGRAIYNQDYVTAICASRLNLAFLRKANRDLQTCRSAEIPACGAVMIHERSPEVAALFAEGEEVGLFGDDDELERLCRSLLEDGAALAEMGRRARLRALANGMSHHHLLRSALTELGLS